MHRCCPSVRLFVCLSVRLSPKGVQKRDFLKNEAIYRAMVSIDDL